MKKLGYFLLSMSVFIVMLSYIFPKHPNTEKHFLSPLANTEFYYNITNDGIVITGIRTDDGILSIPTTIQNQPVIKIGDYLTKYGTSINHIDFSEARYLTTIGVNAFYSQSISHLDFSGAYSLTNISRYAFENNRIESINFADAYNLFYIGDDAFYRNQISGEIDLTSLVNLREIGAGAFADNLITSVNLSGLPYLRLIEQMAFMVNLITYVNLSYLPSLEVMFIGDTTVDTLYVFLGNYLHNLNNVFIVGTPSLVNLSTSNFNSFVGPQRPI